jgi:HEAT repeat protein
MKYVIMACLAVALAGCGNGPPTVSSGKPVAYWVQAVKDPDIRLRKKAVAALGNVGPADAAAIPALTAAVADALPEIRREAILALLKSGRDAHGAIAAITAALQDPDAQVRLVAEKALLKIRGHE